MLELGKYHKLKIIRDSEQGFYLAEDENDDEAVLLPNRYIPTGSKVGDEIEVFLYSDSQGRPIATTLEPRITLHEFGFLKVVGVSNYGAFMDWGIAKDLLVPFKEQNRKLNEGEYSVVYLFLDEVSSRLVGSTKIRKHLDYDNIKCSQDDQVKALVYDENTLGYKVIVNNQHDGIIYKNEVYQSVTIGEHLDAYVKKVRDDGKIDLQIQPPGYKKVAPNAEKILHILQKNDGHLSLSDKSPPEEIKAQLNMSKKTFKKAIGDLYKKRLIRIDENGVNLI
jgi:predicted RNA-binding protein (virulence factor B family)